MMANFLLLQVHTEETGIAGETPQQELSLVAFAQ